MESVNLKYAFGMPVTNKTFPNVFFKRCIKVIQARDQYVCAISPRDDEKSVIRAMRNMSVNAAHKVLISGDDDIIALLHT